MNKTLPDDAQVQPSVNNPSAISATVSLVIGFDIGRTFIFYDNSKSSKDVSKNWENLFNGQAGWTFVQFNEFRKPLGWIAKLSMDEPALVERKNIESLITKLVKAFHKSFHAQLRRSSIETTFFAPGVGILQLELSFPSSADVAGPLKDLSDERKRGQIRIPLDKLAKAAAKCYVDCLETAIATAESEKRQSPIKFFKAVDRSKAEVVDQGKAEVVDHGKADVVDDSNAGYLVFFMVSFVDQSTFDVRARSIRDLLAITDEQRQAFDERARVGYEGTTVFVDWSEALVTGSTGTQKQEIETNFIIAMASWSALSLMERHSSKDVFDVFGQFVGAHANSSSENDIYMRSIAYRDVADASLPIRWSSNSRDLHLLEAIHRNWSSDRLRRVIGERMRALSLHHKRIQQEQRERFEARQDRLNRHLTIFGIIVAISTLASCAASIFNLAHVSGKLAVILSLVFAVLGVVAFLVIFLRWKRSLTAD
jgi:hypothetical protein